MLGAAKLKETIEVTDAMVDCPVRGCTENVERRRRGTYKERTNFTCPVHKIIISPSTFEYPVDFDNLLWKDGPDRKLLARIRRSKRESRFAHNNSEDAVTWNVFRFLEKNGLVEGFLSSVAGTSAKSPEVVYWSYSQKEGASWSELNEARKEFGEKTEQGSEPDIAIKTDGSLFFVEAKLTSKNNTVPKRRGNSWKYETGGDGWFSRVFSSDFRAVAVVEKKYELLRLWLLGTWMAKQQNLDFYLINLVPSKREANIEAAFKKHIKEDSRRRFLRVTWEAIYQYVLKGNSSRDKGIMIRYFKEKTIGYDAKRRLQRAFSTS